MRFERLLPGQHFGLSFRTNASDESETRGKIDLERQRKERMRLILKKNTKKKNNYGLLHAMHSFKVVWRRYVKNDHVIAV